jgi:hypothetical protein
VRSITFDPLTVEGDETLVACKSMFYDSGQCKSHNVNQSGSPPDQGGKPGLAQAFRIPSKSLCAWLICVRRSYRDVRYVGIR